MNKNNIPKEKSHNNLQKQQLTVTAQYVGPIPPPAALKEYDAVLPGAAERILALAEAEAKHRHAMDQETAKQNGIVIDRSFKERKRGQLFGFIIGSLALITCVIALTMGYEKAAIIIGGSTVVGLVTVFVVGRSRRNEKQSSENI